MSPVANRMWMKVEAPARFDRIQQMQDRFQTLCDRIEAGFSTLDTEDGLSEIDSAIVEERKGNTKKASR
jgi:hypothetical protein